MIRQTQNNQSCKLMKREAIVVWPRRIQTQHRLIGVVATYNRRDEETMEAYQYVAPQHQTLNKALCDDYTQDRKQLRRDGC